MNDAMGTIPTEDTFSAFRATTEQFPNVVPLRLRSADAVAQWDRRFDHAPIDMLFIDGDHSMAGAFADLEGWVPHCRIGTPVLMHDYTEPTAGVCAAYAEFSKHAEYGGYLTYRWVIGSMLYAERTK